MKRYKVFFIGMAALTLSFGVLTGCDLEDLFNKDDGTSNESDDNKTNSDSDDKTNGNSDDTTNSSVSKTVTVTGLTGSDGIAIYLYSTTDIKEGSNSVAFSAGYPGKSLTLYDTSSNLANIKDLDFDDTVAWLTNNGTPWTGAGSYYVLIRSSNSSPVISKNKVPFTTASTPIAYSTSTFDEFTPNTSQDGNSDDTTNNSVSKTVTVTGTSGSSMIGIYLCPTAGVKDESDSDAFSWGSPGNSLKLYATTSTIFTDMKNRDEAIERDDWLEENGTPWTGSGSYYVVIVLRNSTTEESQMYISKNKVSFTAASTTIAYSASTFDGFDPNTSQGE